MFETLWSKADIFSLASHLCWTSNIIVPDKAFFFQPKYVNIFLISLLKTYVMGTHKKRLTKALLMSTHNMFSH